MSERRMTQPADDVPTYDGEIPAIAAVEAVGWTVWWHNTGHGIIANAVATHPTNPASPMMLCAHEYPRPTSHRWWWRPMIQFDHVPMSHAPHRIETYWPRRLAKLTVQEWNGRHEDR